jgi:hypothetical protein
MLTKADGESTFLIKHKFMCQIVIYETAPNLDAFRLGNTHSLVAKWVIYPDCSFVFVGLRALTYRLFNDAVLSQCHMASMISEDGNGKK